VKLTLAQIAPHEVVSGQDIGSLPEHEKDARGADGFAGAQAEVGTFLAGLNAQETIIVNGIRRAPLSRPADGHRDAMFLALHVKERQVVLRRAAARGREDEFAAAIGRERHRDRRKAPRGVAVAEVVVHHDLAVHTIERRIQCQQILDKGRIGAAGVGQPNYPFDGRKIPDKSNFAGNLQARLGVRERAGDAVLLCRRLGAPCGQKVSRPFAAVPKRDRRIISTCVHQVRLGP
jgi:hypothetical protein